MTRILVVDDDTKIREMLKQCLERAEYEVLVAPDGKAALELHSVNPVDLIITDIVMPEENGLAVIMQLRRRYPEVKVIAISGGGKMRADEYLDVAKAMGVTRRFSKPFELKELLVAVRELLPNLERHDLMGEALIESSGHVPINGNT
jgi:DNA-binding response OmpR family regulator